MPLLWLSPLVGQILWHDASILEPRIPDTSKSTQGMLPLKKYNIIYIYIYLLTLSVASFRDPELGPPARPAETLQGSHNHPDGTNPQKTTARTEQKKVKKLHNML